MQTWTDEALRALLCEELEAAGSCPLRRKQLIERSAARLGERVESDADLRPGSAVVRGKSRLGMLLTELIHTGVISEDAVGLSARRAGAGSAACRPRGCALLCWRS